MIAELAFAAQITIGTMDHKLETDGMCRQDYCEAPDGPVTRGWSVSHMHDETTKTSPPISRTNPRDAPEIDTIQSMPPDPGYTICGADGYCMHIPPDPAPPPLTQPVDTDGTCRAPKGKFCIVEGGWQARWRDVPLITGEPCDYGWELIQLDHGRTWCVKELRAPRQ
jgi:hypothetical protein